MKKLFIISLLLIQSAYGQMPEEDEVVLDSTSEEEAVLTIKEVKALIKTMPQESTCMDEYLKRRRQLITKLSLTPITGAATIAASVYGGGVVAVAVATASGATGTWAGLGYMIGGGALGAVGSVAYVAYDTTKGAITLADNSLILKALAEQYLGREGIKSEKLYKKYLKKTENPVLSQQEFLQKIMELDASGKLCDGSLLKQPRVKFGSKLKYQIAKSKDIRKFLNAVSVE